MWGVIQEYRRRNTKGGQSVGPRRLRCALSTDGKPCRPEQESERVEALKIAQQHLEKKHDKELLTVVPQSSRQCRLVSETEPTLSGTLRCFAVSASS